MATYTALTTLPDARAADALGEALERMDPAPFGVGVFEVEDGSGLWEVGGYFLERPDEIVLALLAAGFGAAPFAVSEVPDEDWVAHVRRELRPVVAGRYFVYGSHDADKVPEDCVPLLVEASMAFGTGHHGTTQGCLEALDRLVRDGFAPRRVADIGCGTAVLAMAAAKTFSDLGSVIAADIDAVAVDVARANVAANGLAGRVHCLEAAGFGHPEIERAAPFDLVLANILKGPLLELAPDMARLTASGGRVILSGILTRQADEVADHYARHGYSLERRLEIGDWTTLSNLKSS